MRLWQFLSWTNINYIKTKKGNRHGFPFLFSFLQIQELHTFLENGICKKRRIRFLTDAKIGVLYILSVVVSVVLVVVLAAGGCFSLCFKERGRIRDHPKDGSEEFFALTGRIPLIRHAFGKLREHTASRSG